MTLVLEVHAGYSQYGWQGAAICVPAVTDQTQRLSHITHTYVNYTIVTSEISYENFVKYVIK